MGPDLVLEINQILASMVPSLCLSFTPVLPSWRSLLDTRSKTVILPGHSQSPPSRHDAPSLYTVLLHVLQFSSVQLLSHAQLFAAPWIAARQAFLFITISRSSLRLMSIESMMPSSHLILSRPLLLLPPIPPSIRVFSNESTLRMRWPKYWSFSFSIIPSKEIPGLISFRMDWLDLLAVQGTLKSLLQHHSSNTSILRRSAFFTVQLSHPYMTTGKTIALTRRTLVGKVMSLLLNMLSRLVINFLPSSKRLLISWLQSPSAVILYVLINLQAHNGRWNFCRITIFAESSNYTFCRKYCNSFFSGSDRLIVHLWENICQIP